MPGHLDRRRASQLMESEGLSALVLCQPETISYAAGAFPGVATYWRRAGAAFLIVPADKAAPLIAIVGDLQAKTFAAQSRITDVRTHRLWVDTEQYPIVTDSKPLRTSRPAQYELSASLALLHDALVESGLAGQRIGLELGFVPVADFPAFQQLPFKWADCTRIVERLRSIKIANGNQQTAERCRIRRSGLHDARPADCWRNGCPADDRDLEICCHRRSA